MNLATAQNDTAVTFKGWQAKAWQSTKRFLFLCGGVQGGKTTFGSIWIINEAMKRGKGDYIILAPTYRILQQSTLQKFKQYVPLGWGTFNKADSTFVTKDGCTFFLRSVDNPEAIEGITAKAIWADEASQMGEDAWIFMQARVGFTLGRICITTTPSGKNWIYKAVEQDKLNVLKGYPSDIEYIKFRSVDLGWFSMEEYERAKRTMTPAMFSRRYEGAFGTAEGLIYPDFSEDYNVCDPFPIPDDWMKIGGIDWGTRNPFVALKCALDGDDVLYVYDEYYISRSTIADWAAHLDKSITYYGDPSGAQYILELIEKGYTIVSADNAVEPGIARVVARIRSDTDNPKDVRLKVFKPCVHTIYEFGAYRYRDPIRGEIIKEEPLKVDDHAMDSLKYVCAAIELEKGMKIRWI